MLGGRCHWGKEHPQPFGKLRTGEEEEGEMDSRLRGNGEGAGLLGVCIEI